MRSGVSVAMISPLSVFTARAETSAPIEQRRNDLWVAIGDRVLDGIIERGLAADPIHVGHDLPLLDDLATHRRQRFVMGAPIDEADHRYVRQ